jgi:chemotaxis protein methyltransferase CheR
VHMAVVDEDIQLFLDTLKSYTSYDFTDYSEKSLQRRVAKVMSDHKLDIISLTEEIKSNPVFVEKIIKEITVNTTELFRDPATWQALRYKILPKFVNNETINIWHAGCSTGQEVYSMMILLSEMGLFEKSRIHASDINTDVLEAAKSGIYKYRFNLNYLDNFDKVIKENPYNYENFNDVPYSKYFDIDKNKDTIKMHEKLTEKPIFKKHDLVKDQNIFYVKFDIILCRNVIIYFNYNLQNKVFNLFYNNLYDDACLVLGIHETILGPYAGNFEKRDQFYYKK